MGDNWVIDELERRGKEKGLELGRSEGRVEGRTEEARRAVLRVLERRFGEVAVDIRACVEGTSALDKLELLHEEAVTCAGLAQFRKLLERA
jgi:predicted transposase YdaD